MLYIFFAEIHYTEEVIDEFGAQNLKFVEIQEHIIFAQQYQILKKISEGIGINIRTYKIYYGLVFYN